jgi:hypothetical protein
VLAFETAAVDAGGEGADAVPGGGEGVVAAFQLGVGLVVRPGRTTSEGVQ